MRIVKVIGASIGVIVCFFYLGCGSVQIAEAAHNTTVSSLAIATKILPSAITGTPFVAILDATGGTPGYTWKITSGALPSGISLAATTGIISGTPTVSGNFSFSVTLNDAENPTQTKSTAMTISVAAPPLAIVASALPSAAYRTAYSHSLQATGGIPSYKWSVTSGSLPTGLTLASSGVISGIPTASGTSNFTATVQDSEKPAQKASLGMTIIAAPGQLQIIPSALPKAVTGASYSQALQASGGTPAYKWTITSGSVPAGLSLSSSGVIFGTPATSGTSTFTASVSDSSNPIQAASATVTLVVAPTPLAITASTLPSVTVGTAYSQVLKAAGGTAPYTWSITSGKLPAGLTLTSSTGTISGVPTQSGTSAFTASVIDSSRPAQSASAATSVVVAPTPLAIVASALPPVKVGTPYSQALKATGGTAAYTWSITSGKLPPGLTLTPSTGAISGVPTSSGIATFTATVTDSSSPAQASSATRNVVVAPTLLTITSSALPSVTVGAPYQQTLQAAGGTAPYTWSITAGKLPTGLTLVSSIGVISGVTTANGTSTFTVTVTDRSSPAQVTSATTAVVVGSATPVGPAPSVAPIGASALTIATSALPSGTAGSAYSQVLQVTGGTAPYSWSLASGQLPVGLSISAAGVISGTPTTNGTSTFTVTVSDSSSPAQKQSAGLTIATAAGPLAITSLAPHSGTIGSAYSQALTASGGTPAYTWSITSGSLPSGLTIAATTGTISGTPASTGVSTFTAAVSDNGNPVQTQSVTVSITVLSANQITGPGTTWFVRPDGGPRYSATYLPTGDSCDGQSNANMVIGGGPNQHCAWNDPRYVWADGSAAGLMAMSGGDTLILSNTYPAGQTAWRFSGRVGSGGGSGALFNNYQGVSGGDPYTDYNINFPAGTSGAHTRILGANYASCGPGQKTNIFGGFAALTVINLQQTSYVDVQCLDITDHNSCIKHGTAGLPSVCQNVVPYSDYANSGIMTVTNAGTAGSQLPSNIILQDLDIHGFPDSGISGAIGGAFALTRVTSNYNGFAGWNFDFGSAGNGFPNNPAATINAQYVTMDWNGCNEEYPIVDPIPVTYCYSIINQGFGDAWSGQDSDLASMICNHCEMAYNVKDAFFGPHTAIASVTITNSTAYNNGGQTWKANLGYSGQWLMQNTLTNDNCRRLSQPITGAPSTFNTYINGADYCRADGAAIAVVWPATGSFELDNNTFVAASSNVSIDFTCWNTVTAVSVGAGGTGYTFGDVLYAGGTQVSVTVTSVGAGGTITGISLTNGGQVTNSSLPFTETYVYGGTGTGAQITVNTVTPVNCGGGPRIMRNNNFIGYTNTDNPSWNLSQITLFCYSSCNGNPGTSDDTMWTTRSNNNFYGYASGIHGACTYAGETCTSPLMTVQPSQTWTNETQLDPFTPSLSAGSNSFYPTSGSPLVGASVTIAGITTDYYGVTRTSPPVIGAVEP